ncbi:hypothetical protein KAFR_0F03690 [Kazachstania africana CBS 2517]|uniref:Pyridoxamine 5'-phosphate oxidase Alr4036 family FMN-binding domain-containing protein n=1 Tax=Kazachstania africana (strain ATCC 22294 / BCRC 22015 / CBS 2517 / CECT 1963 / NBRC 1671 / NRRL Y-8276) TaxID=1071382 RepID=H2AX65_KAZAF|nr:hypothetical protein KAFR_0F03690 [Kazachstania africana CBS 2517]CCF58965.1 hypothetical protein KAFR_0F03690 [Kazachstania africana CBS 2517]
MTRRQMAPWVPKFIESVTNNKNETNPFNTFQFATISRALEPKVRTVVFRDFLFGDKMNNVLTFNADLRSDKINDIQKNFECCFYFNSTWEQYRFNGRWFVISLNDDFNSCNPEIVDKYGIFIGNDDDDDDDDTRDEHFEKRPESIDWEHEVLRQWNCLSRSAKALYRKPAPGSLLTDETSKILDKIQRGVDGTKEDAGLENFGIICLCIDKVDYLNLKDGRGGERKIFKRVFEVQKEHHYEENTDDDTSKNIHGEEQEAAEIEVWEECDICP